MTLVIYDHGHFFGGGDSDLKRRTQKKDKSINVQQAVMLFKQKGFEEVTVEEITSACGIAKGTFFNYFAKKEHNLLYLSDSYMDVLNQIIHKYQEGTVKTRILNIFDELVSLYGKYFAILRLTLEETLRSSSQMAENSTNLRRFQEAIASLLQEAQKNGTLFSRWDAQKSAAIITGVFVYTIMNWSPPLEKEHLMEELRQQLDILWEGLEHETSKKPHKE